MGYFITSIVSIFVGMYLHAEYMLNATTSKAAHKAMMNVPLFKVDMDNGLIWAVGIGAIALLYQINKSKSVRRRRR